MERGRRLYRKNCIIRAIGMMLIIIMVIGNIPVYAAKKKVVTVKSQGKLLEALENSKVGKIIIKTSKSVTIVIPEVDGSVKKQLEISAPKAVITNETKFKSIIIKKIKEYIEKISGNSISESDSNIKITIADGVRVKKITLAGSKSNVAFGEGSEVNSLVCNKESAKVTLNFGKSSNSSITLSQKTGLILKGKEVGNIIVSSKAQDSNITATVPIQLKALKNTKLVLNKGSEGSDVDISSKAIRVDVKNNTKVEPKYKIGGVEQPKVTPTAALTPEVTPTTTPKPTVSPSPTNSVIVIEGTSGGNNSSGGYGDYSGGSTSSNYSGGSTGNYSSGDFNNGYTGGDSTPAYSEDNSVDANTGDGIGNNGVANDNTDSNSNGNDSSDINISDAENEPTPAIEPSQNPVEEDMDFVGVKTDACHELGLYPKDCDWDYVSGVAQFKGDNGSIYFAVDGDEVVTVYKTENGIIQLETIQLVKQHPIFGTVICDRYGNYYLITGENNESEDTSVNTIFISKYDSQGTHIKTVGFVGSNGWADDSNTRYPFRFGNCDAVICFNILAVNYARIMYNGHQSCNAIAVDINDLNPVDNFTNFYNSHSLAQRLISIEKENAFVFASQGDCYDRAFTIETVITRITFQGEQQYGNGNRGNVFDFWVPEGNLGQNRTYANMGNLVPLSDGRVVLVAKSAQSLNENAEKENREIFIQIFDPFKNLSDPETYTLPGERSGMAGSNGQDSVINYGVKWLTSYQDGEYPSKVQAVATSDDRIFILYELCKDTEKPFNEEISFTETEYLGIYYIVIDNDGNVLSESQCYDEKAMLNACVSPVYADGKIWWVGNRYLGNTPSLVGFENDNIDEVLYLYSLDSGPVTEGFVNQDEEVFDPIEIFPIDNPVVYFPDENFRLEVSSYDVNYDGYIDYHEACSVLEMDLRGDEISDLKGIEIFKNLKSLNCSNNDIEYLDVSALKNLEYLHFNNNEHLTELNMSGCEKLKEVYGWYNVAGTGLTTVNLTDCSAIEILDLSNAKLNSLNLSNFKNLRELDCSNNQLTELNLKGCSSLETLYLQNNQLTMIDLSDCLLLNDKCVYSEGNPDELVIKYAQQ